MKKLILLVTLLCLITSCVNENNDYNYDHDKAYNVPATTLLTNVEKQLSDQMTTPGYSTNVFRFFTQYLTETQYITESRYRISTRKIADNHWNILYRNIIGNLESAKSLVNSEVKIDGIPQIDWDKQQKNKIAILEVLEVYAFQILVDTFGDVPYTDAVNPNVIMPKYEDDASVYPKLISRLNSSIANLDSSGISFETGEIVYNGNVQNWKLFANSLKLKLGINLVDVDNTLAKSTIESAFAAGVITSNANNAKFAYLTSSPNYNPIFDNLVASNRNDFVPTSTLINDMNTLNDPRRTVYFTTFNGNYIGGVYGFSNVYEDYSHVSDLIKKPDAPGILMEATEVYFILAEAAARGYSVGDTESSYYNQAIQSSFDFWGISGLASSYLANPDVAYATAPGATFKEKIGRQAWIALYNRSFEAWNTWRRLDFPNLQAPANAYPEAYGKVPVRYTYPINEQTVNGNNWNAASAAIGGDKLTTKIFWDVN